MIQLLISELIQYGVVHGLIELDDEVYVRNQLMELLACDDYKKEEAIREPRAIHEILEDILNYAISEKLLEEETLVKKDLFDTKVMGIITPRPSVVRRAFKEKYILSPKLATDYFYTFSRATNYIRKDRIDKDKKWVIETKYGTIDVTINLSKPEKDPRDIARAVIDKKSEYPSCLLCKENEGFAGNLHQPARQNHRIIPILLDGEEYYLQYSPYGYYNEHCIVFHKEHIPMKIDKAVFKKLLSFVEMFPHYTIGSNADLPIVGGSILSHDHFQGGNYEFAMAKAPYEKIFAMERWPDVTAGIVKWPMSVIRLQGKKIAEIVDVASHILTKWRGYTDETAFIFSETEGKPHNTITPIARKRKDIYELDLVLRNNITTKEHPLGVFHPHAQWHNIKKENIGLIEAMGYAILPARLNKELEILSGYICTGRDVKENEIIKKHANWVEKFRLNHSNISKENVNEILEKEVGKVFLHVLEDAGVYKCTKEGRVAFERFIDSL